MNRHGPKCAVCGEGLWEEEEEEEEDNNRRGSRTKRSHKRRGSGRFRCDSVESEDHGNRRVHVRCSARCCHCGKTLVGSSFMRVEDTEGGARGEGQT